MSGKRRHGAAGDPAIKKGKREVKAELSEGLKEQAGRETARRAWERGEPGQHGSFTFDSVPFPHCVIQPFVQNSDFLDGLKNELLGLRFNQKSNDLYQFKQSEDLKKRKEPHISALRQVLFEDFREWLSDVTGVKLEKTVDLSCAQYNYTDTLLCHDDELEGRRFAFILYLVPEWLEEYGGSLDLYSTDENTQPGPIAKSLIPKWNSLVFFEVSPVSFHQVSEVLCEGKCRLSVSGWFYGPYLERPPPYFDPSPLRSPHIPHDHEILYEWVNPVYLSVESQSQIQEEFEERSEMLLKNFLQVVIIITNPVSAVCVKQLYADGVVKGWRAGIASSLCFSIKLGQEKKFNEVCAALQTQPIDWEQCGAPNRRCYQRAKGDLPEVISRCMELVRSEAFFLLLSNLTGLSLHFLNPNDESEGEGPSQNESTDSDDAGASQSKTTQDRGEKVPLCSGELRHWTHGHYTLIHDHDPERHEFALDLLLFFGCNDWKEEYGGFTSYIAKEEDEELLTVYPENNCLALVYRDKETMKFVKHINHKSLQREAKHPNQEGFWDFAFAYHE